MGVIYRYPTVQTREKRHKLANLLVSTEWAFNVRYRVHKFRIRMIHKILGLPDPDPLVRGTDQDSDPDPSIIKQN
jgi:hypothetical protein